MTITALRNFSEIVTMKGAYIKDGRNITPEDLSIIYNASIIVDEKEILWVGEDCTFPEEHKSISSQSYHGKTLTPGLVDCHTHLVFGGDRSHEYSMRLNGADYQEIASSGGGILATMKATNESSKEKLLEVSKERVNNIIARGVKTLEIKSGYGLNFEQELELSQLIGELKEYFSGQITICNTFLAAHAVPKEFNSSHHYMQQVVIPLLKELAPKKIIDAVDIFHEDGFFDSEDVTQLFELAQGLNIDCKSHADEFKDNQGAALAVKFKALSCDHLLCTSQNGIDLLAKSDTVATLLPGTGFFLGKPQANARAFLDAGVKVAIASDYNPGSCHCDNVLLMAAMAAPTYKMNIGELWCAITLNAAHALGLKERGAIIPGLTPSFTMFDAKSCDLITYHWGKI
ncbi:MAG: imidazolonepropionase [Bdellovibrionales bacterium]|jgi:imidazolonepropionase|nr:imidazolonepropionase [Bdellovibrionales bacterium]MBT3526029.1 imidazolonepropionase [Bdellovibrionales bacterium]MBT7669020.1 imidazolonepropionase [Bdellovibrionales bacterium]